MQYQSFIAVIVLIAYHIRGILASPAGMEERAVACRLGPLPFVINIMESFSRPVSSFCSIFLEPTTITAATVTPTVYAR
jgi:hypothetical protein